MSVSHSRPGDYALLFLLRVKEREMCLYCRAPAGSFCTTTNVRRSDTPRKVRTLSLTRMHMERVRLYEKHLLRSMEDKEFEETMTL